MSGKQPWSTGLCDCFSDCFVCCYGFWCQPCAYGSSAHEIDGGSCCGHCCIYYLAHLICAHACVAACTRKKLRDNYNLEEATCGDCLPHCFCQACAVCQDYREIKHRKAVQPQFATMPPAQQYMVPPPQYMPPPPQQPYGMPPPQHY